MSAMRSRCIVSDSGRTVNLGSVVSVRGSVVDLRFEHCLPPVAPNADR
jgi:hypothetical protein